MLELEPRWAHLNRYLSRVHEARGEFDAAVSEARAATARDPDAVIFREALVDLLIRIGRIDDAAKEAENSVSEFPGKGWPFLQLSRVWGAKGDVGQGLEYARKSYDLQPEKRAHSANLAHFLRLSHEYGEVEDFCREAIAREPGQGWAWRELCRVAEERGDRERAIETGAKAIAVHPDDSEFCRYYDALVSADGCGKS